jgi:hypothetical protein
MLYHVILYHVVWYYHSWVHIKMINIIIVIIISISIVIVAIIIRSLSDHCHHCMFFNHHSILLYIVCIYIYNIYIYHLCHVQYILLSSSQDTPSSFPRQSSTDHQREG